MTLELPYILVMISNDVKIMYRFCSSLWHFLLRYNYGAYLFDAAKFFDGVRITLYFSTFELSREITLQIGHFLLMLVCNHKMTTKNT